MGADSGDDLQRRAAHQHGAHQHGAGQDGAATSRVRLGVALAVAGVVLVVEVAGAVLSGSLALLADAGHVLTDAAGLAVALGASVLAGRPATPRRTYGLRRVEVLAAAAQALLLLAVGLAVAADAVARLVSAPPVDPGPMAVAGAVGLAGNLVALAALAGGRQRDLNLRAAFLEVVGDVLGSVAVLAAAAVVAGTGLVRADPVASLVIGLLIVPRTLLLLRDTVEVLLESTPRGVDLDRVRAHLLEVDHVRAVHDLHASTVASGLPVLTGHVVVDGSCFGDGHLPVLLDRLQGCLAGHFDVEHSTLQFEPAGHAEHEHPAHT